MSIRCWFGFHAWRSFGNRVRTCQRKGCAKAQVLTWNDWGQGIWN